MNDVDTQDKSDQLMFCWYSCNKSTHRIPVLLVIPNFHSTIHAHSQLKMVSRTSPPLSRRRRPTTPTRRRRRPRHRVRISPPTLTTTRRSRRARIIPTTTTTRRRRDTLRVTSSFRCCAPLLLSRRCDGSRHRMGVTPVPVPALPASWWWCN